MSTASARARWSLRAISLLIIVVAAIGLGLLWLARSQRTAAAAQTLQAKADAGPLVEVAIVQAGPTTREITLLGEAQPYQSATLYAQVSGYLKTIHVDRGDSVRKDQVLAEIASPQIDAQYRGALATLADAQVTLRRNIGLLDKHFVSQQAVDDARTAVHTAQAAADNLHSQIIYETIRAPFDGTITARFADPGALMQNASSSQTSALPIVTVTDIKRLRVRVYVEQQDAAQIQVGDDAMVRSSTDASIADHATVSRKADQLDAQTRTMLTEIDVDNTNGAIVSGSFVNATLHLAATTHPSIPATALILHGQQTLVALLGDDNHVHLTPVVLASTDGAHAQIASGVALGQRVVLNAGALPDGGLVRPRKPEAPPAADTRHSSE